MTNAVYVGPRATLTESTLAVGSGRLVTLPPGTPVVINGTNHDGTPAQTFLVETADGQYGAEVCGSYLDME